MTPDIKTLQKLTENLYLIMQTVADQTGCPIYLGWGIVDTENDRILTDSMSSDSMCWSHACRIMVSLTESIAKEYPQPPLPSNDTKE